MKAITCSQCGALVKRISLKEKFAHCDYCGAKILIADNKERIIEIREKEPIVQKPQLPKLDQREQDRLFKTMVELNNEEHTYNDTKKVYRTIIALVFFGSFVFVPILITTLYYEKTQPKITKKTESVRVDFKPTPAAVDETPEPLPEINYRSYVQYNTNIGADLIEIPVIRLEQLPTTDLAELRKTVFAQRKVRVRITIDEAGEVSDARALNGHRVLQDSSVEAAEKSLFSARKRKTATVLTYIYILE